ncbi:ABC transporter ATP-binding protein [uncultured Martelella sp.]|uniref:ABC transporter ATP-binding protein n=1 Tax=uncultured Martelella sp. TaxID=392331 RepID=UPI0029C9087B|nr:ABC transporter ATP-binding protein [uncultured Martelella sp.]
MTQHSDDAGQKSSGPDYFASLRLIWPHMASEKLQLAHAIGWATLSVVLELVPVYVIYRVLQSALAGTLTVSVAGLYAAIALVAVIGTWLALAAAMSGAHRIAFAAIYRLRLAIARHLARLPLGYFADRRSGEAKKLMIDDPEKLELVVAHGIPEGIGAFGTWLAVSVFLFAIDWRLALATVFITPVSFVLLVLAMKRGGRHVDAYQAAGGRMNAAIVEFLAGMPVVKIFNRPGEGFREASEAVSAYAAVETRWARAYLPLGGTFFSLILSNIVFIVPVAAYLASRGETDIVTILLFVILGANYSRPLMKLFNLFHELAHISVGSQLIAGVLAEAPQHDTGRRAALSGHDVVFENVSFGYGSGDVVTDVSFIARSGTVTALVGPSGSGKSTLASLIPRFFDVRAGRITIGGVDIRDMAQEQLMDTVAFVFQQTFLFTGTVADNIRFGNPDASDEAVEAAAVAARAHDFIAALPDGYATKIGDRGAVLSGGERQRIAIARAILKDAPVIVLDEATAFADPDNEAAIQQAIEALAKGRTLIIVAHRLHTIRDAETIIAIENGQVAETGRHDDLLAHDGLYARLWRDFIAARETGLRQTAEKEA